MTQDLGLLFIVSIFLQTMI